MLELWIIAQYIGGILILLIGIFGLVCILQELLLRITRHIIKNSSKTDKTITHKTLSAGVEQLQNIGKSPVAEKPIIRPPAQCNYPRRPELDYLIDDCIPCRNTPYVVNGIYENN